MSYEDMARSHVECLLREGMGLEEVIRDPDGDFPFRRGTASYYLSVLPGGHTVRLWSYVVVGLRSTVAVLREVNTVNARLVHSRLYLDRDRLMLEAVLPVEPLQADYLLAVCFEIGEVADSVGQLMAAVHGGSVFFDDAEVETAGG